MRIALVACCKTKLDRPAEARDLYCSPLFRLSRQYAEQNCDKWYILSAKYGLVGPRKVIEPYDLKLSEASRKDRIAWTLQVNREIAQRHEEGDFYVILAGLEYRVALGGYDCIDLPLKLFPHDSPLTHLGIGQRMAWLKRELEKDKG